MKIDILKEEFSQTFSSWRYILYRSYVVRKSQSRHSALGLISDPLLLVISSIAITLVWNKLFGRGGDEYWGFFVYIFMSFSIWNLMTDLITGAVNSLRKNATAATNTSEPLLLYVILESCSAFVNFSMRLPLMLALTLIAVSGVVPTDFFVLIYGLVLLLLTSLGFGLCIGMYCLFYGDIKDIVNAVVRLAFLLTPIIWHVERLGEYQKWVYLNPFYSYLTLCRNTFIGLPVDLLSAQIATIITIVFVILGLFVLSTYKFRARERFFSL